MSTKTTIWIAGVCLVHLALFSLEVGCSNSPLTTYRLHCPLADLNECMVVQDILLQSENSDVKRDEVPIEHKLHKPEQINCLSRQCDLITVQLANHESSGIDKRKAPPRNSKLVCRLGTELTADGVHCFPLEGLYIG